MFISSGSFFTFGSPEGDLPCPHLFLRFLSRSSTPALLLCVGGKVSIPCFLCVSGPQAARHYLLSKAFVFNGRLFPKNIFTQVAGLSFRPNDVGFQNLHTATKII